MKETEQQFKSFLQRKTYITVVILFLTVLAISVYYKVQLDEQYSEQLRLERSVDVYAAEFKFKIRSYLSNLENIAGFYGSTNFVEYDEFISFVKPMIEKESGIHALEWIPKVALNKLATHEKYSRLYFDDYYIWQLNSSGAKEVVTSRDYYYPVMYVWPKVGNEAAIGYDLASNKYRLQALKLTQNRGEATATARIKLVQQHKNDKDEAAFLIFSPYYKKYQQHDKQQSYTKQQYQDNLKGFILGVFKVSKMFESVIKNLPAKGFDIQLVDTTQKHYPEILYRHQTRLTPVKSDSDQSHQRENGIVVKREFNFANRMWSLYFYPTVYYQKSDRQFDSKYILLIACLLIFLVLCCLLILRARMIRLYLHEQQDVSLRLTREREQRAIIETLGEAIIVFDESGKIESVNHIACEMFHYQAHDIITKNIECIIPRLINDNKKLVTCDRKILIKIRNGEKILLKIVLKNTTVNGRLIFAAIITDITASTEYEKQLIAAKKYADAGVKSKNEFLATMSHEIRMPMNGVLGMVQIIRETELSIEQQDYIEIIYNSGNALLEVINDILDFSKIEAGQLKLDPIVFNLEQLILDVIELLSQKARQKNLRLIFNYCDNCPDSVVGDPGRIRQVLINLIGNSIKFTKQGYIYISVALIRKNNLECSFHININDTGLGISKDYISKLFDSFTQANLSTTRNYGGTGLGLAICKQLVNLMQGVIGVDSEFGVGSTFWFEIPLLDSPTNEPLQNYNFEKKSVLVVDKFQKSREQLKIQLSSMNINVECLDSTVNVSNVLSQANQKNSAFDAVIFDSNNEKNTVLELINNIRMQQEFKDTAIILLTSDPKIGDAKRYQSAGATAYLTKPLLNSVFSECLLKIFSLSSYVDQDLITRHSIKDINESNQGNAIKFDGHVLIAEDNVVNQKVIEVMLLKLGISCVFAENGEQAVTKWTEHDFDLIFMDCHMPIMDGYRATAAIRHIEKIKQLKAIPIVALTANVLKSDRQACFDVGMDDFLAKPIVVGILQDLLQKWLGVHYSELQKGSTRNVRDEQQQNDAFTEFTVLNNDFKSYLDLHKIEQLRQLMGEAFSNLISTYVDSSAEKLEQIKTALAAMDSKQLYSLAHGLKGTSGNIGAEQMFLLASKIELQSKQQQLNNIDVIVDELLEAFTNTRAELDKIVQQKP